MSIAKYTYFRVGNFVVAAAADILKLHTNAGFVVAEFVSEGKADQYVAFMNSLEG